MKFKNWIYEPGKIDEASYPGNIGFEEMVKYYNVATKSQIKDLENAIKTENWEDFKNLIRKVVGVNLK